MARTVWFDDGLAEQIRQMGEAMSPRETGGILMGYVADNEDVVVTKLIGPGKNAEHKISGFKPDHDYQMTVLREHFDKTSGQDSYLGDWHTHPNCRAELSSLDLRTLARISISVSDHIRHPVMAVASLENGSFDLRAYRFESRRRGWFHSYAETSEMKVVF